MDGNQHFFYAIFFKGILCDDIVFFQNNHQNLKENFIFIFFLSHLDFDSSLVAFFFNKKINI